VRKSVNRLCTKIVRKNSFLICCWWFITSKHRYFYIFRKFRIKRMKIKGINYNAGIQYNSSKKVSGKIDLNRLKRDLTLLKKLNCNAIRMYGTLVDKLFSYSEEALKHGFSVWISPRLIDGTKKETLDYVRFCSRKAEQLRKGYKKVVFIVGNELLIDSRAIFNVARKWQRINFLKSYINFKYSIKNEIAKLRRIYQPMHKFLEKTESSIKNFVELLRITAKKCFKGKITYASFPFEKIDWSKFDIVSINFYKSQWNASKYIEELRKFKSFGKPVAITEFGTCAYKGASKLGGAAYDIVKYPEKTIKEGIVRDESEQAKYLRELIEIYKKENIFAAFVFDFKEEHKIYSRNPRKDLDLSSFGIVKVLKNGEVVTKKSFDVIKKLYDKRA